MFVLDALETALLLEGRLFHAYISLHVVHRFLLDDHSGEATGGRFRTGLHSGWSEPGGRRGHPLFLHGHLTQLKLGEPQGCGSLDRALVDLERCTTSHLQLHRTQRCDRPQVGRQDVVVGWRAVLEEVGVMEQLGGSEQFLFAPDPVVDNDVGLGEQGVVAWEVEVALDLGVRAGPVITLLVRRKGRGRQQRTQTELRGRRGVISETSERCIVYYHFTFVSSIYIYIR